MAEGIGNKVFSWTRNVVKEISPAPMFGVGVNLALVPPPTGASSSTTASPAKTSYNRIGVDSIHPDGPAAKAGLKSGDVILEVDGRDFGSGDRPYVPEDVAGAIRGPEGSEVNVVVGRGGERMEFVLKREPIGPASPPPSPLRKALQRRQEAAAQRKQREDQLRKMQAKEEGGKSEIQSKEEGDTSCEHQAKKNTGEVGSKAKEKIKTVHESLKSLTLEEEEHKEKDLASSAEDADQFDAEVPVHRGSLLSSPIPHMASGSADEISEEKSNSEEISSIINSVGDESQWELISERSGSAIVLSINGSFSGCGSFRSASPSVLKNKFVLTESSGEPYLEHVVLPTDTLQGLCLAYKTSATKLRMSNGFSGNSLQMAPKKLRIPNDKAPKGMMVRTQDRNSTEYKLYALVAEMPSMELVEAKAYLDLSNWDLDEALRSAREDEGWSLKGGGGFDGPPPPAVVGGELTAVRKPKALTAEDIYAAPPAFEGDGFELKDINRG